MSNKNLLQEFDSDIEVSSDESMESGYSMNFDQDHLTEALTRVFDSFLFDLDEINTTLGSFRVNLKKEIDPDVITSQRRELRQRFNLKERCEQALGDKQADLVSLRLKEDQMHLVLFLEETAQSEASHILSNTFTDLKPTLREELAHIMEPITCHYTMTLGKSSMVQWFNETILPLFLVDSPSTLYLLCEECWMTVHDTLKKKVKSMNGFREYKKQKKLEIRKIKQENSNFQMPSVTFAKHPFTPLSPKISPVKKAIFNEPPKLNSLTYVNANSTLIKSSNSRTQSPNTNNYLSPTSLSPMNSNSSSSNSSPSMTFGSSYSSLSGSPKPLVKPNKSPEQRWNKRRDLCGTKKVKVIKGTNHSPQQLQLPLQQPKRKRESLDIPDPIYFSKSGSTSLNSSSSSGGSNSDEYLDLLKKYPYQTATTPEKTELTNRYQYKPGRFRF